MPPVLIPDFVKIKVIKVTNPITIKVNINENTITWINEGSTFFRWWSSDSF
ncbi:hypothetical protein HYE34_00215 [Mycoplasmopsis bovis]|nr:hypothetical protein HYE34_00215 [Mycoplasmopsis bovis]QQH28413.1 hypothetical protein HYE01_00220 [Mycoplasmopsis bovis]